MIFTLSVSRIGQKLVNRASQNSQERWHMGHRRTDHILAVVTRITLL